MNNEVEVWGNVQKCFLKSEKGLTQQNLIRGRMKSGCKENQKNHFKCFLGVLLNKIEKILHLY